MNTLPEGKCKVIRYLVNECNCECWRICIALDVTEEQINYALGI